MRSPAQQLESCADSLRGIVLTLNGPEIQLFGRLDCGRRKTWKRKPAASSSGKLIVGHGLMACDAG
jgi:hypothetical protein